jgi:hypothetical protein
MCSETCVFRISLSFLAGGLFNRQTELGNQVLIFNNEKKRGRKKK